MSADMSPKKSMSTTANVHADMSMQTERRETVRRMLAEGREVKEIAAQTGMSEKQIRRIRQQMKLHAANHPEETPSPASQPSTETIAPTNTERAAISRTARNVPTRTIEPRCTGQLT